MATPGLGLLLVFGLLMVPAGLSQAILDPFTTDPFTNNSTLTPDSSSNGGTYQPSSEKRFSHSAAEALAPQDSKEPVQGCLPI
ncbi:protein crumbs homolog 3-like [Acomys russatus]|uniref:protein crumbs homolog 3-like n=1 Tax=Acomys russatus TaxID=60746 RepID=UPI0021E2E8DF|nr:protein crumbs homolog 3-like [Acomys russatus]